MAKESQKLFLCDDPVAMISEYFTRTVRQMKAAGTYRPECESLVRIYADSLTEYQQIKYFSENADVEGESDKDYSRELDTLKLTILRYADALMISPKEAAKIKKAEKKESKFEALTNRRA